MLNLLEVTRTCSKDKVYTIVNVYVCYVFFCAAKIYLSDHMQIASVSSQDSSELHYLTRFQNDAGKLRHISP